ANGARSRSRRTRPPSRRWSSNCRASSSIDNVAVYTTLSAAQLAALIAQYDVGELVSAKGIAEGVSNSNWLIETTGVDGAGARFILTMYEARVEVADLPFFLGLLDHLAAKGSPVPRTIHDRAGAPYRQVDGKAVALIEFLPGVS